MKTALIFPGQGSQAVGMGKELAENFPQARRVFEEVDDALSQKLSTVMWDGPAETLTLTANTQPALMAVSLAVIRVLEAEAGLDIGREAAYVAGHSLGEYSALAAAGSLTISDTARLLRIRGDAMQKAVPVGEGAMAAILGLERDAVDAIAREAAGTEVCDVANDNGNGQVVVSGHKAAVERAAALAQSRGAKRAVMLAVSAPFHCSLMAPAADAMRDALGEVPLGAPVVPVVINVEARPESDPAKLVDGLVRQVTATVRWRESMIYMASENVEAFYEIGSGKVLTGLGKRLAPAAQFMSIGTKADVAAFVQSFRA
ncbi:MAG: ACP S-malonyltransferase [Methylobacteriaceae bacterium]|jgi:[acyl-carrier-protein] S-malonyltransferase|nr:ACP S-malonyltransferase [Methylobacteriaceae bacterium]